MSPTPRSRGAFPRLPPCAARGQTALSSIPENQLGAQCRLWGSQHGPLEPPGLKGGDTAREALPVPTSSSSQDTPPPPRATQGKLRLLG